MDGDNTAKTFEQGANSAVKDTDLTQGLHESYNQTVCFIPPNLTPSTIDPGCIICSQQLVKRLREQGRVCSIKAVRWDQSSMVCGATAGVLVKGEMTLVSRRSHRRYSPEDWGPF